MSRNLETQSTGVTLWKTRIYSHNFIEACDRYTVMLYRWHSYIIQVIHHRYPVLLSSVKVVLISWMSQESSHQFSCKTTWQRNVSFCNTHIQICNIPWKWNWSVLQTRLHIVLGWAEVWFTLSHESWGLKRVQHFLPVLDVPIVSNTSF